MNWNPEPSLRFANSFDIEAHLFVDLPILHFEQFNDLCRRVYFATEDYTLATFILVNGGLSFLFAEVGMQKGSDSDAQEYFKLCRENFLYGLSRFNILTAPTVENLQALLLGVSIHPSLADPILSE